MFHLVPERLFPHRRRTANPRIDPLLAHVIVRGDRDLQGVVLLLPGAGCPEWV